MKKIYLAAPLLGLMATAAAYAAAPSTLGVDEGGVNTRQYHSYDGLICTDCHTLHNSEDGSVVGVDGGGKYGTGPNRELLKRGDWTDMCLSCHKDGQNTSATAALPDVYNSGWTAPIVMTANGTPSDANYNMPAGDFYYSTINSGKNGHNPAYTPGAATPTSLFLMGDPVLKNNPPGGTIVDGEWSCHSCHGMHSRFSSGYTAYRQLKRTVNGKKITGDVSGKGVENATGNVTQDADYEPILSNSRGDLGEDGLTYVTERKDGNALQGADLFAKNSDTNKNVYQGGFSSFCSACHGDFHGKTQTEKGGVDNTQTADGIWQRHPTNLLMAQPSGRKYGINTYSVAVKNTQTKQVNPPGYDFRYPLVKADADFKVLSTVASAGDPLTLAGTDRIMCLTCHKAHASQYENMTRWNTNDHSFIKAGAPDVEGLTYDPATATLVPGTSQGDNAAFGCGKCHQKGGTAAYVRAF